MQSCILPSVGQLTGAVYKSVCVFIRNECVCVRVFCIYFGEFLFLCPFFLLFPFTVCNTTTTIKNNGSSVEVKEQQQKQQYLTSN